MVIKSILFCLLINMAHPIHVSVCDITPSGQNELTFTFKIFFDDLQTAMGLRPGEELPKKYKGSDQLINEFITSHVSVSIDGKPMTLTYSESFSNPPAIWTEMIIKDVNLKTAKKMTITNKIMSSLYKDQKNIVNILTDSKKETFALDNKTTEITINF